MIEAFQQIPLNAHASVALLPAAFQRAVGMGITIYDALYVALAEQLHAPLISADGRLIAKVQTSGLAIQLVGIGDIEQLLT